MASSSWFCHQRDCHTVMGTLVNGELVVNTDPDAVSIVNTDGASLVVTCNKCGRPNKWFPKDSALIEAVLGTHLVRALIENIGHILKNPRYIDAMGEGDDEG